MLYCNGTLYMTFNVHVHYALEYLFNCFWFIFRFEDKTKNKWEERDSFVKVPGKYDMLEMDYGADEVRE